MKSDEVTTQHIEYTRTIVPSSMRSPYWKYFGFPSDNSNNILTKQKIICTSCNTAIAYNKNTSNLRTHLVARHPDLLNEIQNQKKRGYSELTISSEFISSKLYDGQAKEKRPKTLYTLMFASDQSSTKPQRLVEEDEEEVEEHEVVEAIVEDKITEASEEYESYGNTLNQVEQEFEFEDINETATKAPPTLASASEAIPVEQLILEMLITDVLPLSTIEGTGFLRLLWNYAGNTTAIRKDTVEQNLQKMYCREFKKVENHFKSMSNSMPYSISVETYCNVERKTIMCVYINYLMAPMNDLVCVLYRTTEVDDYTDYSEIFSKLNLKNCSAAIVNNDNRVLEAFLNSHNISIIPCFESVINRCMSAIFDLPTVDVAYKKILKLVEKLREADSYGESSMSESYPDVYEENPWSKYNFLQFVQDNSTFKDEESNASLEIIKQLLNFLNPFKITLETISEEPMPLSSLVRPLTVKLLEEHFSAYISEFDFLTEIRNILNDELTMSILSNSFLNEATFFDPRFQHGFVDSNSSVSTIKKSISDRFKHLIDDLELEDKPIKAEATGTSRKSSLKFFFNRNNEQTPSVPPIARKRCLDYEIPKYTSELAVDLEQCPIEWWESNAFNYRQLKKISAFYLAVPCCGSRLFKYSTSERIEVTSKRFMLTRREAVPLWFLHFNSEFLGKLKSHPTPNTKNNNTGNTTTTTTTTYNTS